MCGDTATSVAVTKVVVVAAAANMMKMKSELIMGLRAQVKTEVIGRPVKIDK